MVAQVDIHVAISFLVSEATRESCVYYIGGLQKMNRRNQNMAQLCVQHAYKLGCCLMNDFIVKPLVWLHSDPAQLEQDIT